MGYPLHYSWASLVAQLGKNPPEMQETWFNPWVGKIQYSDLENSYSPCGCKESQNTTERLSLSGGAGSREGVTHLDTFD